VIDIINTNKIESLIHNAMKGNIMHKVLQAGNGDPPPKPMAPIYKKPKKK